MNKKVKGNFLLLITSVIWGTAFVAQSKGMDYIEPFTYNSLRTLLGGIILIPLILIVRNIRKKQTPSSHQSETSKKDTITGGIICGLCLYFASSFQQSGISMTSAGKAGFITSLYIIIVPLIGFVISKKTSLKVWIHTFIAAIGFYFLCISNDFKINKGDLLVLCSALFFAFHIIIIDYFNQKKTDGMVMSCIQFFTAGILMFISMLIFETPSINSVYDARYTIMYTGIMSCGVAYTLQIIGQRDTEPSTATLIMSLESVFAALSGWLILNEKLSSKEITGCILVFIAVMIAQYKPVKKNENGESL